MRDWYQQSVSRQASRALRPGVRRASPGKSRAPAAAADRPSSRAGPPARRHRGWRGRSSGAWRARISAAPAGRAAHQLATRRRRVTAARPGLSGRAAAPRSAAIRRRAIRSAPRPRSPPRCSASRVHCSRSARRQRAGAAVPPGAPTKPQCRCRRARSCRHAHTVHLVGWRALVASLASLAFGNSSSMSAVRSSARCDSMRSDRICVSSSRICRSASAYWPIQ